MLFNYRFRYQIFEGLDSSDVVDTVDLRTAIRNLVYDLYQEFYENPIDNLYHVVWIYNNNRPICTLTWISSKYDWSIYLSSFNSSHTDILTTRVRHGYKPAYYEL